MGYTFDYLTEVGRNIAAEDVVLAEARLRVDRVQSAASKFPGSLRTYDSGSLAHHTVTTPVSDGDGGLVLNRVSYPSLGPDGDGETPEQVTADLCALLGPQLRKTYPNARCSTSRRGPLIRFGDPMDGQDPSVDLVVALTRKEGSGLWIPDLDNDTWEASDPEKHVTLFATGTTSLVRARRRVVRLSKVWNKKYTLPAFSSFHLSVLARQHVESGMGIVTGLRTMFENAAQDLEDEIPTEDPAGVSPDLHLQHGVSTQTAARRMRKAAEQLSDALMKDDQQDKVADALDGLFPADVSPTWAGNAYSSALSSLKTGSATTTSVGLAGATTLLTPTRAYGRPGSIR